MKDEQVAPVLRVNDAVATGKYLRTSISPEASERIALMLRLIVAFDVQQNLFVDEPEEHHLLDRYQHLSCFSEVLASTNTLSNIHPANGDEWKWIFGSNFADRRVPGSRFKGVLVLVRADAVEYHAVRPFAA